jgi:superfamily II DNA/RNA helicase
MLGIGALNLMQNDVLKAWNKHDELVVISPTGSGKTLAFLLPMLGLTLQENRFPAALVIVPTRELALQIESVWKSMRTGLKVNACYGGHDIKMEVRNLSRPPFLLVSTPGRLADHLRRGNVRLPHLQMLVWDEFDKSLELGFHEEMAFIMEHIPQVQKKGLFSATECAEIPDFTKLSHPTSLRFSKEEQPGEQSSLSMFRVTANENDKADVLLRLLGQINPKRTLIFCNHRDAVERLGRFLEDSGVPAAIFHGKLEQDKRELALSKLRNGSARVLVCTDLGSRGLDIPEVDTVMHYQLPLHKEEFIHRNGRTARMHASGQVFLVLREGESLPPFVQADIPSYPVSEAFQAFTLPDWETLYIGGGRKNKINKVDVAGLLMTKGGLDKNEVGLIEVTDFSAYAAVSRPKMKGLLERLRHEKIKGQKVKIARAR